MKVKYFVLAGAVGMLTMVGMPQTEASALEDVMGAETRMVSMYHQDESIAGSIVRNVEHKVRDEVDRTRDRIETKIHKEVEGIFRGFFR